MVRKDKFISTYNKYNGNIPKVAEKLNMKINTAYKAKVKHFGRTSKVKTNPIKIVNKTEPAINNIKVKVDTVMNADNLTSFIKNLQKSGKTITLTVK